MFGSDVVASGATREMNAVPRGTPPFVGVGVSTTPCVLLPTPGFGVFGVFESVGSRFLILVAGLDCGADGAIILLCVNIFYEIVHDRSIDDLIFEQYIFQFFELGSIFS
jgi:hypothetical protein